MYKYHVNKLKSTNKAICYMFTRNTFKKYMNFASKVFFV